MLVQHSEPCSTTSRCSRPPTRAVCRRASYEADLPCKNAIQMQAAQAADCPRSNLDNHLCSSQLRAEAAAGGSVEAFLTGNFIRAVAVEAQYRAKALGLCQGARRRTASRSASTRCLP